ncbi:MAG: hypothetical protein H6835_00505 [Planctomycetes bacterium]|nr:hypothetical protein [Planctomycetota bacterium]
MKSVLLAAACLLTAACASLTPAEHAELVAAQPGTKALRVGVVVLGVDRTLGEAFADVPAAPGGAAPLVAPGVVYADQTLLPESLPADDVVAALQRLGAFTDVVPLPFDARGVASREAMIQRVQDRVWPLAVAQELDALLVVEGVRDHGLRWSDRDEGLFTLDSVLWWLTWPFGLWIDDRSYAADCALVAGLFRLGDPSSNPQPTELLATPGAVSLDPWQRASAPLLNLVLPPAWVGDDRQAVAGLVHDWSRAMLPIELVRAIKGHELVEPANVTLQLRRVPDGYELQVGSDQEVVEAAVVALPRGALTDAAEPRDVALTTEIEMTAQGPRHRCRGSVARDALDVPSTSLLRASVTLGSGERVSRTWVAAELPR